MESSFWQINFWGILGSITGVLSLIVSWLAYKNNLPKITLGRVYLVSNMYLLDSFKKNELKDGEIFKAYTYFHAFNANTGPGSFERPTLKLYKGSRLILRLFPDYEGAEDRIIYLAGGEGKKIVQKYSFRLEQYRDNNLLDLISNFDVNAQINYELIYRDNFGKEHIIEGLSEHEPNKEAIDYFNSTTVPIHYY
jgi:hypothetical protein